ncbi:Trans-aconitate 2-methyltransferase|nr:Trans-aconitate 2-methyltransferase [Candidatus Pantoea persica]
MPRLTGQLDAGGALALQMPDNLDEPSHRLMREIAACDPWRQRIDPAAERKRLLSAESYYDLLMRAVC